MRSRSDPGGSARGRSPASGGSPSRGQSGDLVEHRVGVGVAGPQALEVEHAEAAEATDLTAVAGLTAESMAEPSNGRSKV
jgi:hypothetical protein